MSHILIMLYISRIIRQIISIILFHDFLVLTLFILDIQF